jgi:ATP-dependent Clp protease ATP-binding subunit ClpA
MKATHVPAAALLAVVYADVRELVMERVRKHFQPEFLNRIDEFICFEPLRYGCC